MQLNTVMYQLLTPAAVLGPAGVENWTPVVGAPDPAELRQYANDQKLPRWAILACVCIDGGPPPVAGLIRGLNGAPAGVLAS